MWELLMQDVPEKKKIAVEIYRAADNFIVTSVFSFGSRNKNINCHSPVLKINI